MKGRLKMDRQGRKFICTSELQRLSGLGKTRCMEISRLIGAVRHYPGVRKDFHDIDVWLAYLDGLDDRKEA